MRSRQGVAAAVAAAALIVTAAGCGADTETTAGPATTAAAPPVTTAPAPAAQQPVRRLKPPLAFHLRRRAQLRSRPDGRVLKPLSTRTSFRSPRIMAVTARRPGWVAVRTEALRNNRVGWLPADAGVLFSEPRTIVIDLSARTLSLYHRGHRTTKVRVVIGAKGTPTPVGRFAVTDRLKTGDRSGPYGCCILALTGHQPKIAQGWGGGDRIAIHATPATWALGKAVSHGCVRASNAALRKLMRQVRLGTPVRIRR